MPIKIDQDKCDGCGICIYDCGANVIGFGADNDTVSPFWNKRCVNCFLCELVCPEKAIQVVLPRPRRHKAGATK